MSKLDGEAVEKEVAGNVRTMHKTGKAFAQRGLQAYATNCDTMKAEIEEFQKVVPLLVVSCTPPSRFWYMTRKQEFCYTSMRMFDFAGSWLDTQNRLIHTAQMLAKQIVRTGAQA